MSWLAEALHQTAEPPHPASIETFRAHLDPDWIEMALEATGSASMRRRRLPAEQVIWLVLGMSLMRNRPIREVAARLELVLPSKQDESPIASSAIVQARARLGEEPLQWLFQHCSRKWAHESARTHALRGLALYALDATTLRVADSNENRAHFGVPNGGVGNDGGYPVVRVAALMAVRSRLLAAADFGPFHRGEHTLSESLWAEIPDHSITLVDRGFFGARILLGLQRGGTERHWVTRAKKNNRWRVLESFGPDDKLVEFNVSAVARTEDGTLPKTFVARAVRYQNRSNQTHYVLTSLVDPERFPASEVLALYRERWEIELGYDEIKTHLLEREDTIRSRTVDGVRQEVWGILLTYNLIRLEMARIADEAHVSPSRISFVAALRLIRDEWLWCAVATPGSIPAKLRRMREDVLSQALPPRRSDRSYPRAVKVATSKYPKKHRFPKLSDVN